MESMEVDDVVEDLRTEFACAQRALWRRIRVLERMLLNLLHDYYELKQRTR
jgi:hypothetical protein